ncbi:unnamed protein product [Ectocarpus sp. CCAP 1310/34]|nr:unnamed protein product [Ectocarpus sp. CCAP 1310/34]
MSNAFYNTDASRVAQRPAAGARTGNGTGEMSSAGKSKGRDRGNTPRGEEEEEISEAAAAAAAPGKRKRGNEDGAGTGKGKQKKRGGRSAVGGAAAGNAPENGAALAGDREQEEKEQEKENGNGDQGENGQNKGKQKKGKRVYAKGQPVTYRRPGQLQKAACGGKGGLAVCEQGQRMRKRLGLEADGYVFLHHRDCDHLFVVSDIRIEPVPVPPPEPELTAVHLSGGPPAAAMAALEEKSRDGGSAATTGQQQQQQQQHQQQQQQQQEAGSLSSAAHPDGGGGAADRGGSVAAASTGGVSTENTAAVGGGRGEGKKEEYPRLSFLSNPNCRRCGICLTKTAVKMSFGHPLSDKASLFCCQECFEMLHLDTDQKPLEGELAGDVATTPPPGDTTSPSPTQGPEASQAAGGPRGWRVFRCYDEH